MTDDYSELLGAFALDALDAEEAEEVRRHLAGCPRCAAEVAQHHEVAALLASSGGGEAPAHLWEAIEGRLGSAGPGEEPAAPSDVVGGAEVVAFPSDGRGPRLAGADAGRWAAGRRRGAGGAATWGAAGLAVAAAVAAIVVLGVKVSHLDNQVQSLATANANLGVVAAAQSAMIDTGARHVVLASAGPGARPVAELVILPSGTSYLVDSDLRGLPVSRTYQLWGATKGGLVSLGLLGDHPLDVAFHVDPRATFSTFAVTAEHAGGVVHSRQKPVATSED